MTTSRRDFLQRTAAGSAAAALTLAARELSAMPPDARATAEDSKVREFEDKMVVAHPVPLGSVRLTGGPLKVAQDVTARYLLSLDP
ncbi:MAG TPA: twin-arginine translocation signal domain-containing protein, partial [Gemmatimonadaceae bacterium]|nr:twin-arginine translocation signal domain-containing protein [Gemmatimonadaceae bacterium]